MTSEEVNQAINYEINDFKDNLLLTSLSFLHDNLLIAIIDHFPTASNREIVHTVAYPGAK
jgi:hypothetical protein